MQDYEVLDTLKIEGRGTVIRVRAGEDDPDIKIGDTILDESNHPYIVASVGMIDYRTLPATEEEEKERMRTHALLVEGEFPKECRQIHKQTEKKPTPEILENEDFKGLCQFMGFDFKKIKRCDIENKGNIYLFFFGKENARRSGGESDASDLVLRAEIKGNKKVGMNTTIKSDALLYDDIHEYDNPFMWECMGSEEDFMADFHRREENSSEERPDQGILLGKKALKEWETKGVVETTCPKCRCQPAIHPNRNPIVECSCGYVMAMKPDDPEQGGISIATGRPI